MKPHYRFRTSLLALLCLSMTLILTIGVSAQDTSAETLKLGIISSEPTDSILTWTPFVDYLVNGLGGYGVESGIVVVASDMETMGNWLAEGEVDFFFDSFYTAMTTSAYACSESSASLFLVRNRPDKSAVFFTVADSGLVTLDDLEAHLVTMEEPDSTSGFMLPMAFMLDAGYSAVEVESADTVVADNEIGYVFAGDDEVVVQWVLRGITLAGIVDNETFEEFDAENPGQMVALVETDAVIRDQPVIFRPGFDPELYMAIETMLLSMDESDAAQPILETTETMQFSNFREEREEDLARAQAMFDVVSTTIFDMEAICSETE